MHDTAAAALSEEDRLKIVLGVLLAMALAALDQTIVSPAVPAIRAALNDDVYFPWIVSAYFLTATAATPLYGKLADIHGRRVMIFTAIGLFTAGSVCCALSANMLMMILSRGLQGLGGGGLIALVQTVIADVVAPKERGRYVVYITTIWATSSIAGPILGGFLSEYVHWSLIFWINLPLALAAFLMTSKVLLKLPQIRRDHSLDYLGALALLTATVCLMLALTWGGTRYAWSATPILGLLGLSALFAALFVWRLTAAEEPLVPLSVLANPIVRLGTLSIFFVMGAFIALSAYLPIYFEVTYGFDASQAGNALVILLGGTVLGANTTGRYMARVRHYKSMALYGCMAAACATAVFAWTAGTLSFPLTALLLAVIGVGVGGVFPIATVSVQNAVDMANLGVTTGTMAFLRSLGSTIGVSVLGAILASYGVVDGHRMPGQGGAQALAGNIGFSLAFGVAACSMALTVVLLFLMEEKPLRGRDAGAAGAPEA